MWQYLWPLTVCVTENEVPGRFTPPSPRVVSPLFPFAPVRFAPIPVHPGSFRPHLLIVLSKMKYRKYHCKYSYFGCCKACSWILYFCHN